MKNQSKTLTKFIYNLKFLRYSLYIKLTKKNFDYDYENLVEIYKFEPIAFLEKTKELSVQTKEELKKYRRNMWNLRKEYLLNKKERQ